MVLLCLAGILVYHYWDYWQVRAGLSRLDGAQVVVLRAEPAIRLEQIHGTLRLEDGREFQLGSLTPESFRSTDVIQIGEMSGWQVVTQGCDCTHQQVDVKTGERQCSVYLTTGFEIGKHGDHGRLVPFPVQNIQDLVDRYDEIVGIVESMPEYPRYGHLVAGNGNELYYQRYPADLDLDARLDSVLRDHTLEFAGPGCNR